MKVLVTLSSKPQRRYLIKLFSRSLIQEVRELIHDKKNFEAVSAVITRGQFDRPVDEHEIGSISADLILSEDCARWDLVK